MNRGLFGLEQNWVGDIRHNDAVQRTLSTWQSIEAQMAKEQLETNPARFLPEVVAEDLDGDVVPLDIDRPMAEIRAELSKHPIRTRLSLTGTMEPGVQGAGRRSRGSWRLRRQVTCAYSR